MSKSIAPEYYKIEREGSCLHRYIIYYSYDGKSYRPIFESTTAYNYPKYFTTFDDAKAYLKLVVKLNFGIVLK